MTDHAASPASPRIPPLPRDRWTDDAREVFAFWGEPDAWENGSKTNTMNTFAQHPKLAIAHSNFGKHLLMDSDISVRARELVVLRVAWHTKSEYEWHYHVGYAINGGITLDEIAATKADLGAHAWDEHDRAVLGAVDELIADSRIGDETWTTLARHFDTRQLMDLVFTVGNYVMTAWVISSFGIQVEDGVDRIGFDLRTASGGTPHATFRPREVSDWTDRNTTPAEG
jgi:alkylhydroperoxidase family enzyme